MMLLIEKQKEDIKSYYVARDVANATKQQKDIAYALSILDEINKTRVSLAIIAETNEVYWSQVNVPSQASLLTTYNDWFSKNDRSFTIKRGIASLLVTVKLNLEIQGGQRKVITRNPTAWQMLFADIQRTTPLGQQTLFDLPEELRFNENQSLNLAITGQGTAAENIGYIFLHGATRKENLEEATITDLWKEILDGKETRYLPESQIIPLQFEFPSATVDTFATDGQGNENIFSVKNDRSVFLTHVSTTASDCRIHLLNDEGRNQNFCERIEMRGVAANFSNQFQSWYELPKPHLLRRGDRLKAIIQNGSLITGDEQAANVAHVLAFKGMTL